ncbi:hypothetical protein DYH09_33845 [bacterium CPR1]|nr:hypothetical protein [bacterium CPR1]
MQVSAAEAEEALELARTAFPHLCDWQYEILDEESDYQGFTLWGVHSIQLDRYQVRRFFVTLASYKAVWRGHLSIGQHAFMWTSADYGDAYLVDTRDCATLPEAIRSLKQEIAGLFAAFSVSGEDVAKATLAQGTKGALPKAGEGIDSGSCLK